MLKRTPLYEEHKKLGARIVDFAGWEMPVQYSGVTDEHLTVRKSAGLFDVSHMGTFEISGDETTRFLDYLTPSNCAKLSELQATYSLLLNEGGTIVDDIIIYKLNQRRFLLVVNASNKEKDFEWVKSHLRGKVSLKDLSGETTLIALQGPKAALVLSSICEENLDDVGKFCLKYIFVKGASKTLVARTGYTGEDGFEIFAKPAEAAAIWNSLLEAGKSQGIKPAGLGARDTLRLEMGYTLYGHEISDKTNALEAGLRWVIKFKKPEDFIGKDALLKIREKGLKRKLVGFTLLEKGIPRNGYKIFSGDKDVGIVTSGTFSPSLQRPIGIGYVKNGLDEVGAKFSVDIRGRKRLAEVVKTPFLNN